MAEYLIANATVVTQNPDRDVIPEGAVATDDGEIIGVGPAQAVREEVDAAETIDASGHVVLPGFVDAHAHVSDILLRGYTREDHTLFDWLHNVKNPGLMAMTTREHRIAAELYCAEAMRAGVTTFVENALGGDWEGGMAAAKMDVYDRAGIRNVFARGILDEPARGEHGWLQAIKEGRHSEVEHPPLDVPPAADQLDATEALIEEYHGSAGGRQSVWVAPAVVEGVSEKALSGAARLAETHDVMTTTHVSESPHQENRLLSSVEFLDDIGYLGERTLLGHCVHVTDRDVRLLADSGTRVTHNLMTNLRLGSGIAPLTQFRSRSIPVGIGTDNSTLSDTVDPLNDARMVALLHKGYQEDPGVITAQDALDMITIEAARAIRRGDTLGSIEPGKKADLVVLDAARPRMTPSPNPVDAVVYGGGTHAIDTVFCDGEPVVRGGSVETLSEVGDGLLDAAETAAAGLVERTGIDTVRER
ncbi:MAG: amidohydrolase family protein [Halobacteriales archaeon]